MQSSVHGNSRTITPGQDQTSRPAGKSGELFNFDAKTDRRGLAFLWALLMRDAQIFLHGRGTPPHHNHMGICWHRAGTGPWGVSERLGGSIEKIIELFHSYFRGICVCGLYVSPHSTRSNWAMPGSWGETIFKVCENVAVILGELSCLYTVNI